MLIAGIFTDSIKNMFEYGIFSLLLYIDSVVYKIVSMLFSVFYSIAELQLLNSDVYEAIANRVYLLVGVIALFAITVSLMKALVNPDNFAKGTITSFKNLVISILLVILMPTIFKYAFSLQTAIISDGVIANVFNFSISGKETQMVNMCNNPQKVTVGNAASTLNSDDETVEYTVNDCQANFITMQVLKAFFQPYDSSISNNYKTSWDNAEKYMIYTGNFDYILTFVEQVTNGTDTNYITYYALLSTAAGIFLGYIVLSFCIDLGVRAFKLAFYQLIAPIPILMKIIPGKEGQFDKWSKQTISTFLEVFVRLIIISFVVFMCGNLFDLLESFELGNVNFLAKAILALGLFTFAKQAPKLLKDALGLEGGNLKLGIKGKLVEGGAFTAGAALGAGATALTRNGINAWKEGSKNVANANGFGGKLKAGAGALVGGLGSTVAGTVSGLARGGKAGWSAKSATEMRKAAGDAASTAVDKRIARATYKAAHGGNTAGVMKGHAMDALDSVKKWAGIGPSTALSASEQREYNILKGMKDRVKNIENLWKNEKQWIDAEAANNYAKSELQAFSNSSDIMKILNQNVKDARKADKSLSMDDAVANAVNAIYDSASANDKDILNRNISKYIDLANKSSEAENFLNATTQTIKESKTNAINSLTSQLNEYRKANEEFSNYIGKAGDAYDSAKPNYTKRLNELDEINARGVIGSDKK